MAPELEMDTCDSCDKEIEAIPNEIVRCEDCWAKHWDAYKKPTTTQAGSSGDGLKVGEAVYFAEGFHLKHFVGHKAIVQEVAGTIAHLMWADGTGTRIPMSVAVKYLARIPPAQTEPVPHQPCTCTGYCKGKEGLGEAWYCVLGSAGSQAEPVEAKEPWKPKMGDTVLLPVKAVTDVLVDGGIVVRFGSDTRWVQSSQLRPLPVVQGEGVGK